MTRGQVYGRGKRACPLFWRAPNGSERTVDAFDTTLAAPPARWPDLATFHFGGLAPVTGRMYSWPALGNGTFPPVHSCRKTQRVQGAVLLAATSKAEHSTANYSSWIGSLGTANYLSCALFTEGDLSTCSLSSFGIFSFAFFLGA
jgi:hypothetical protein